MSDDYLQDLADSLRKGRKVSDSAPLSQPVGRASPVSASLGTSRGQSVVKAAGRGGIVMDFGGHTGNAVCDRFNWILGQHADPVQAAVASDQRRLFDQALMGFAKSGVEPNQGGGSSEGIDPGWNQQLNRPLDQQVVEMVKAEGLGNQQHGHVPGATGAFNKSQMQLGGETLVGQSETDAAVIEMMKSMQDAAGPDDGEFVIDATEG